MLLDVHRDHKDYQGRGAQDVHFEFNTGPASYWHSSSMFLYVHRNRRFIRDWEPWTSTSSFTQLLSSDLWWSTLERWMTTQPSWRHHNDVTPGPTYDIKMTSHVAPMRCISQRPCARPGITSLSVLTVQFAIKINFSVSLWTEASIRMNNRISDGKSRKSLA